MRVGKLSNEDLKSIILGKIRAVRDDIITRPGIGEDCAVVDFGSQAMVISTDPITGASSDIGRIAVNINCNDIAASGADPVGVTLTILAPEGTILSELELIMEDACVAASELGIEILGGHTEITTAVNRIVICATAIGKAKKDNLVSSTNAKEGNAIIMTKTAGLEGTGIIVSDKPEVAGFLTDSEISSGMDLLSLISVVKDGHIGSKAGVSAMHDVTEGGILGAVWELSEACGLGCVIYEDRIKIHDVTRKVCSHYKIDPLKLISSGSMIMAIDDSKAEYLLEKLRAEGLEAENIGNLVNGEKVIVKSGVRTVIESPESDELYKVID